MKEPIKIGLALSGGAARSVTHIGVLKALEERGIEVSCIAGTSGGAIIAAFYASGIPTGRMFEIASQTRLTDLGGFGFRRLGFFSSKKLQRLIVDHVGDIRFDQLRVPCAIVVTDLLTGRREVVDSGSVAVAAQASCCIPQIYAPVEMNGGLYVDGGLVDYMPISALTPFAPTLRIGVNLGFHRREDYRPRHLLSLIMHVMGLVAQQNAVFSSREADVVIRPDLRNFSSFEIKEAEAMVDVGYRETLARIDDIERLWNETRSVRTRVRRWLDRLRRGDRSAAVGAGGG